VTSHPPSAGVHLSNVKRPQRNDYLTKSIRSQNYGSVDLGWSIEELTRRTLFNYIAQPHKLIYPLLWLHVTPILKIVHRRISILIFYFPALNQLHCIT